ncbi:MAG: hypothetical protein LBC99_03350 [Spirochaetota bacterium]|jgi:hypothetical protein|nr:hypothetical protein [Spirochaetota bacterium]
MQNKYGVLLASLENKDVFAYFVRFAPRASEVGVRASEKDGATGAGYFPKIPRSMDAKTPR